MYLIHFVFVYMLKLFGKLPIGPIFTFFFALVSWAYEKYNERKKWQRYMVFGLLFLKKTADINIPWDSPIYNYRIIYYILYLHRYNKIHSIPNTYILPTYIKCCVFHVTFFCCRTSLRYSNWSTHAFRTMTNYTYACLRRPSKTNRCKLGLGVCPTPILCWTHPCH